jgi:UDP-glucose 4-epimerase
MKKNNRLIILGGGFISSSIKRFLSKKGKTVMQIRKKKIDLSKISQVKNLPNIIKKDDIVFIAAALAPVKNKKMYDYNIKIAKNMTKIFKKLKFYKFIYLSSDAVYSDTSYKITETSKTLPQSMHGQMHLKREKMFKKLTNNELIIIRPTLVYGPKDPHNGYGPNKFIRDSKNKLLINLFGKGEELRDHIFIDDLVKIIEKIIYGNFQGVFNIASGKVISFFQIANVIKNSFSKEVCLSFNQRKGPMPHNGYRAFNINKLKKKFRNLKIKKITKPFFKKLIKDY